MTIMEDRPVVDAVYPQGMVGEPDGPFIYIPEFGMRVPSFIDAREDLIPPQARCFKRLNYHIPKKFRGYYRANKFPEQYRHHIQDSLTLDDQGFVLCSGTRKDGQQCPKRAVNLCGFCPNHGGALHPCDKTLMADTPAGDLAVQNNPEHIGKLSRADRIAGGLTPISELSDDEIIGGFIYDDDGRKVMKSRMSKKVHQMMVKELHARMNDFMQMQLPSMLQRVRDIAMSNLAEPETSLKASIWLAERTIGKTPDVIIHGQTDTPYSTILENIDRIQSGSREDYRKSLDPNFVASQRVDAESNAVLDVSIVDDPSMEEDGSEAEIEPDVEEESQESESDSEQSFDDLSSGPTRADQLVNTRKAALDLSKARKKAKQKRFVARMLGTSLDGDMAWPVLWKRIEGNDGSVAYIGRPVCPEDLNESMLARIEAAAADMDVEN